jgi:phosphatidylserine decarboxylase
MVIYGIYYALALLAGGAVVTWLVGWPAALPFYLLAVFCLNFFRDPERTVPPGAVAVSPADGKVLGVHADDAGGGSVYIFMNVFDVHVNRTPIPGRVAKIEYKKGEFLNASREDASRLNEQNTFTIDGEFDGRRTRVVFSQIAGLIARRIICYKQVGDVLKAGERVGLIKFGSRVDIFFGPEWEILVRAGERVSAGSSVVARFRDGSNTGTT